MTTKIHEAFAARKRTPGTNVEMTDGCVPIAGDSMIRTLHTEIKVIDEAKGIVDYIASDESIDSYREIVKASGWKFNRFRKNAPFVDSHRYDSVDRMLGKVLDWRIEKNQLIERVQWAIDNPEHKLAQIGWKLTVSGFLKAVSVGFIPVRWVTRWDDDEGYLKELDRLGLDTDSGVRVIYLEQEQIELSACIIGANGNAVARAFKADALTDQDLETLSATTEALITRNRSTLPGAAADSPSQAEREVKFLRDLNQILNK